MTTTNKKNDLVQEEYETTPVPQDKRKSLFSVTMVWAGFPMIITSAVTGATLVHAMGFAQGMLAVLLGNLLLFGYVGLLSILGAKYGMNFGMLASRTFGKKGYMIATGLLSTLVIGWFAVQTSLTGESMAAAYDVSLFVVTLIAGLLFLAATLIGIKALTVIGAVSVPLFLIMGIYSVVDVWQSGTDIWSYQGTADLVIPMGVAVTMVFALFVDSGTMTADFTRWAKNGKHAVIATLSAFPIGNMIAMAIGGIIAASVAGSSGDVFGIAASKGGLLTLLAIIFLFANLGSVCMHCLYNGAVGWSFITGKKMRTLTLILGIIGIVLAVAGAYNYFIHWLELLGVIVPPIGAILIVDQLVVRRHMSDQMETLRYTPFIAWGAGSLTALIAHYQFTSLSTAVIGIVIAAVTYLIISAFSKHNKKDLNVREAA
ncbi:cytosine permease [Gracilibacillus alcaliphilus]|uniref:cytosine permease n=1 Tax=Gracilibacillus alcaliphilus TaxID=1401441 RepID=UPI00195C8E7A|nr:cytosine permease [Gracilibacillus alcaliphilus]MBM7676442.1 cytosine permease [Gracilibacillus alcaliphilus]